jgi:putative transposase
MEVRTARYKLKPSVQQYAALCGVRWHLRNLRNASLQELKDSYRAARREAARHGRDRPIGEDWIVVRHEEIADFMVWQATKEPDLRRRHEQAEDRRVAKVAHRIASGDPKADPADLTRRPWKAKDSSSFGRSISKVDQIRRLLEIRASDPEGIGAIPHSLLMDQIDIVHKAMDAFFERVKAGLKPGFPRFKSYDRVRSMGCPIGDGIQLRLDAATGRARLHAKMLWHGAMDVNFHRDLLGNPKTIRLTYDGRFWWTTIACEVEIDAVTHTRPGTSIGLDAGVNTLLAFDDGTLVPNPKFLEEDASHIRRLARSLARCRRASHNRIKAKRQLARARKRTADRRATHHHKLSNDVVAKAETIFVEDLKIKNMVRSAAGTVDEPGTNVAQKRGLNRGMQDAAIFALYGMIRYKAASAGGRVIAVDPRHTSQDCSECGGREPDARRRSRYRCSCGADLDADHNAARNVLARGLLAA